MYRFFSKLIAPKIKKIILFGFATNSFYHLFNYQAALTTCESNMQLLNSRTIIQNFYGVQEYDIVLFIAQDLHKEIKYYKNLQKIFEEEFGDKVQIQVINKDEVEKIEEVRRSLKNNIDFSDNMLNNYCFVKPKGSNNYYMLCNSQQQFSNQIKKNILLIRKIIQPFLEIDNEDINFSNQGIINSSNYILSCKLNKKIQFEQIIRQMIVQQKINPYDNFYFVDQQSKKQIFKQNIKKNSLCYFQNNLQGLMDMYQSNNFQELTMDKFTCLQNINSDQFIEILNINNVQGPIFVNDNQYTTFLKLIKLLNQKKTLGLINFNSKTNEDWLKDELQNICELQEQFKKEIVFVIFQDQNLKQIFRTNNEQTQDSIWIYENLNKKQKIDLSKQSLENYLTEKNYRYNEAYQYTPNKIKEISSINIQDLLKKQDSIKIIANLNQIQKQTIKQQFMDKNIDNIYFLSKNNQIPQDFEIHLNPYLVTYQNGILKNIQEFQKIEKLIDNLNQLLLKILI